MIKKTLLNLIDKAGFELRRKSQQPAFFVRTNNIFRKLIGNQYPVIFDVGAHCGESVQNFRKLFNGARIYSFEPDPESFQKLSTGCGDLDNVSLYNFGFTTDQYAIRSIDLLKLDVQGHERQCLQGAEKSLDFVKVIHLEIIFSDMYDVSYNFYDIESIIVPSGFDLYAITRKSDLDNEDRIAQCEAVYFNRNYIFNAHQKRVQESVELEI